MRFFAIALCALLIGCSSTKYNRQIDDETQASAAVGSVHFFRWISKALMHVVKNTTISIGIDVDTKQQEK